jgi:phage terminase large subunit-like protein
VTILPAAVPVGLDKARWLMATLPSPSDHAVDLVLTDAQVDFLIDFYAPGIRRGALQGAKGIGKSPIGAMTALEALAGPDAPSDPLVQIGALSEDQANSTVYSLVLQLVRANDRRVAQRLGIDDGRGRLYLVGRPGKLEAVTSVAGSHEGERTTFAVLDETHLWTRQNGGQALARTIRRNVAKAGGRTLELSNAHEPGLGSVAEQTAADSAAAKPGILFVASRPSRQPEPTMTDDELRPLLAEVYAGAPWIDQARILAELRDPAVPWDEGARYYLNSPTATASVLVDPARWTALQPKTGAAIAPGSRVGVGFDGSHSHDGTALVVCDETGRHRLELLIERSPTDPLNWTVPRAKVNAAVAAVFERYDVGRMFADPYHWYDEIDDWAARYGDTIVIPYPTNSGRRFGPAVDRFRTALAEGRISHDGNPDLARHLANARLVRTGGRAADDGHALFTLEKAGPGRLIDASVAAVLAHEAAMTMPTIEAPAPQPSIYETQPIRAIELADW